MLHTALWSLLCQTLQDHEVVFICANISDGEHVNEVLAANEISGYVACAADCQSRSERFKLATRFCKGQWIVVLDCDDILHPDALWTVYRSLMKFPIFNFFSGSHKVFDSWKGLLAENPAAPLAQSIKSLSHGFRQRHFWGFRNDPSRWPPRLLETQYPVEDYWFFAVLAMNSVPVLHIPHFLYAWRRHPDQWTQWHKLDSQIMCDKIRLYLRQFMAKQSAMWHWGDIALATRLNVCMVRLEEEVRLGDDT